jgi:hypothetical protein
MTETKAGFGHSERRYFKRLETALLVAPRDARRRLLDVARQHMGERPPAGSYDELVEALGLPVAYARELMADEGVEPQPSRWRHTAAQFRSPESIVAGIVAVLLAGGAAWWAANWFTEEPTFTNNCGGTPGSDPRVPVEHVSAAGEDEIRIGYVDGAEVGVFLCLTSTETVQVLDIALPDVPRALFRPVEVRAGPGDVQLEDLEPMEPFTLVSSSDPDVGGWWQVSVLGPLTNCEFWAEGSSYSFDEATLTYRFRGRTRTAPIDLLSTYAFVGGSDEDCPRAGPGRTP